MVTLSRTDKSQPTVPSPPQASNLIFGTFLNISMAGPGPPSVKSKTCRGLSSHWNFCISLAPWLPPDLGLRKTRIGATPGEGMGLAQNGRSLASAASSALLFPLAKWANSAFFFNFFLGEFFRLDLKLDLRGTLTIHDGGTMSCERE